MDFNEMVGADENGGMNLFLFSQADIVNDSEGKDVELYEGMEVSVYDDDFDLDNRPDVLLAEGIIIRNTLENYPHVKWLIKLKKCKGRNKGNNDGQLHLPIWASKTDHHNYIYCMSDLSG